MSEDSWNRNIADILPICSGVVTSHYSFYLGELRKLTGIELKMRSHYCEVTTAGSPAESGGLIRGFHGMISQMGN